ncbi:MAG: hypothetical protein EOM59_10785 [Clostridia bacterium]|nr:hypothetical protein [Clostridia bacterium]
MVEPITQATPITETPVTPEVPATTIEEKDITTLIDEATAETSPDKDGKSADSVVPEKYDIKLPDGVELDTETLDIFSPIFKELNLPAEGVQKLVDAYVPLVTGVVEKSRQESLKEFQKITEEWKSETMKELGSDSKTKLSYVGKAVQKFGDNELKELMNSTGVGNHKALVRFLSKVGQTISEDAFVPGSAPTKQDPLAIMYPTMVQK